MDREVTEVISMEAEPTCVVLANYANPLSVISNGNEMNTVKLNRGITEVRDPLPSHMPMQSFKNEVDTTFTQGQHDMFSFNAATQPGSHTTFTEHEKKWARLLREVGEFDNGSNMEIQENRRPDLEPSE